VVCLSNTYKNPSIWHLGCHLGTTCHKKSPGTRINTGGSRNCLLLSTSQPKPSKYPSENSPVHRQPSLPFSRLFSFSFFLFFFLSLFLPLFPLSFKNQLFTFLLFIFQNKNNQPNPHSFKKHRKIKSFKGFFSFFFFSIALFSGLLKQENEQERKTKGLKINNENRTKENIKA
jgi:hypothetical protein